MCTSRRFEPAFIISVVTGLTLLRGAVLAQELTIDLGDIAAGGNGGGTASGDLIGINPDSGLLDLGFNDGPIGAGDGMAFQPVADETSPFIDSVFLIELEAMAINSAGVTFPFPPEDVLSPATTWGQVLNNRIGGELTRPVSIGGMVFEHGVGIHAAAGITYDLDEIRDLHGPDGVRRATAFAGMGDSAFTPDPGTAGFVTTYLILSDDVEVLDFAFHRASTDDAETRGMFLCLAIPPEARYLTLATGAGNGQFYYNAGSFGEAQISGESTCPKSCPADGDTHCTGLTVDPAGGPPGMYTARATARDDSGEPVLYTFSATNGFENLRSGPQAEDSTVFDLGPGLWTISASADDDAVCPDEAPDAACAAVEVSTCPAAGDTHCTGLTVDPPGGEPGIFTATATASDDSGDSVRFTFTASNGADPAAVRGPKTEGSGVFYLNTGTWTISAHVDDEVACPDEAADAACATVQVVVGEAPEGLDLGDIAAGGDGLGSAAPEVVGINPDSGLLDLGFNDGPIGVGDGMALQPVADKTSFLIDSVFLIELEQMPINSAGVSFTFPPEDVLTPPEAWGQILNNRIGGEVTPISIGGTAFDRGVGIHAVAGITYDLSEIRDVHGPEAVGSVTAFAGMGDSAYDPGGTPGFVTTYVILSNDSQVIASASHRASTDDSDFRGKVLELPIPPEAKYVTLASGAGTPLDREPRFYFNAGTFGGARIVAAAPLGVGPFKRGDCNQDGANVGQVTDGVFLLNFIFLGGPRPICLAACDMNGDGAVPGSPTDAIYFFNFNFLGGPPIPEPLRECALSADPEDMALGCSEPRGCT